MTSIYQLMQCSTFFIVLSCYSLTSLVSAVPTGLALTDAVEDRNGFSRDDDHFQRKKNPSTPAFLVTRTRLTVRATPKNSTLPQQPRDFLRRDDPQSLIAINIRCRIKCIVEKVQDFPNVFFHLQIDNDTILPLNSGIPGVNIFTSASDSRTQKPFRDVDDRREVTTYRLDIHLTLNANAYPLFRRGDNKLFCRAHSPSIGLQNSDGFIVHRQ